MLSGLEKIKEEATVVRKIVEEIGKLCDRSWEDFYGFFKRVERKSVCDYKCALMLIKSYCNCAKINIGDS